MIVSIPNSEEATDAYFASGKAPAYRTHINAMPSANPIAISQGKDCLLGQIGCLSKIRIVARNKKAVKRVTRVFGISSLRADALWPNAKVPANPMAAIIENTIVSPMCGMSSSLESERTATMDTPATIMITASH